jgi:Kef-type K+ transport system membrane component KefB
LSRLFGALAVWLRQPPVIGEIAAGILVGPTLIGSGLSTTLFPTDVRPFLTVLANLGVAMFMFLIGLEINRGLLRKQGPVAATVSVASILLPFGLGIALATFLYQQHHSGNRLGFLLLLGAAMSVTAFPVLVRPLTDRGIRHTALGNLALACAAVDDVLAWTLLAVVIAISGGQTSLLLLLAIPYLAVMLFVVRPLLRRYLSGADIAAGVLLDVGVGAEGQAPAGDAEFVS